MLAIEKKIGAELKKLAGYTFSEVAEVTGWTARRCVYKEPGKYDYIDSDYSPIEKGEKIGDKGITVFFHNTIKLPAACKGKRTALKLRMGGEGCVLINGVHYNGLDYNRNLIPLGVIEDDKPIDVVAEVNCKDLLPDSKNFYGIGLCITESSIVVKNENTWNCYYRLKTINSYINDYPEEFSKAKARNILYKALLELDYSSYESLENTAGIVCESIISSLSSLKNLRIPATVYAVGHSHIDVAWHWTVDETVRKVSRTFSSALRLMENYPDFRFSQSMPILYSFAEKYYPELFSQVEKRIKEKRWETLGSMFLEPDCNLISGESFIRQIIYGKKYWKTKFGTDSRICFLPDTFGFSGAMPQILKKAGTDYFFTTKLYWNETNKFPYSLFEWKGIDGTCVLAGVQSMGDIYGPHLYNGDGSPEGIACSLSDFKNKGDELPVLYLYGYGDGGGGVTPEMCEHFKTVQDLPFTPYIKMGSVTEYFEEAEREAKCKTLPVWDGTLYFEKHRGTFTTRFENKKHNRLSEILFRNAELFEAMLFAEKGIVPKNLEEGWKLILLNQFHDILPGTSIDEVYARSAKEYAEVKEIGEDAIRSSIGEIAENNGCFTVYNPLSWPVTGIVNKNTKGKKILDSNGKEVCQTVKTDGSVDFLAEEIPAFGFRRFTVSDDSSASESPVKDMRTIDTGCLTVTFNDDGELVSVYDKAENREVIKEGEVGNKLRLLSDPPVEWGAAWETTEKRYDKEVPFRTESFSLVADNALYAEFVLERKAGCSTVTQRITVYKDSKLIKFATKVDWNEKHKTLRVDFPVDVRSTEAYCDCAFGCQAVPNHRSTTVDAAKFEVAAHKWIDISEESYGVAVLNDSTYGHSVDDSVIGLTLLKSTDYPALDCEKGVHEFAYYFYPHSGSKANAAVQEKGYEVNNQLMVIDKDLPDSFNGFISIDASGVIVDTVKVSEDGKDIIVRAYETYNARKNCHLGFAFNVTGCHECNLLEENAEPVDVVGNGIDFSIKPFEIKTFRISVR